MKMIEHARKYCEAGLSVFPLYPKSKRPHSKLLKATGFKRYDAFHDTYIGTWTPLQKKAAPLELIEEWWGEEPDSNIGCVTGEVSGITVIDLDQPKDGQDDKRTVESMREKICDMTMTSITGSGGMHLFCKYSDVRSTTKTGHAQVDVKSNGGYVVLPPSVHDKTGRRYRWDDIATFNADFDNLADFPDPLMRSLKRQERTMNKTEDWKNIMTGVAHGSRDTSMTKLAGKLARVVRLDLNNDKVFAPVMWDFLRFVNEKNKPSLSEKDLKKIFNSIVMRNMYGEE